MRYSPKFFHDGLPEWKRKKDPILSRVLYRPVSFVLSSLFCEIGWSANMVSYFSVAVALGACLSFVIGQPILGALLINLWLFLDCADGNIARCVKKEKYGDFADSSSSYICVGLMFVSIGYCSYFSGGGLIPAGDPLIILIGALAGSSDSLMRLCFQKYQNSSSKQGLDVSVSENPEEETGINKIRIKIDAYVSLGGFLPVAVLIAASLNCLDLVCIIWAVYYVCVFALSFIYLVKKTFDANREAS